MPDGPLAGKVAIVTGAGTGLGATTAKVFARAGAAVTITGRRTEKLDAVAAAIRAAGGAVLVQPGDVARSADVHRWVERTAGEFGGVDILVNNAGRHSQFRITHEVEDEVFDDFIATNLRGPFLMTKAVIPHILARGGGSIVNIASMAGIVGLKYSVSYCAAKGGLVQMTRTVALDYADKGIRVNCICPGGIADTENNEGRPEEEFALVRDAVGPGAPIGRPARPEEIAEAILYLVGPLGGAVTGAIIPIDGGYTAR